MSNTDMIRLLIVDDEPDMLRMLSFVLSRDGFEVDIAESGADAIELANSKSFDVVITDLKMPGISGIDTLREIKRIRPQTQVIVSSGYATAQTELQCTEAGAYAFVHKPYEVEFLKGVLRNARLRSLQ